MPVFDFSDAPVANEHPECTYETFHSTETKASADKPIVVIDNKQRSGRIMRSVCLQIR